MNISSSLLIDQVVAENDALNVTFFKAGLLINLALPSKSIGRANGNFIIWARMVILSSSRPILRIGLFRKRATIGDHSTKLVSSYTQESVGN